MAIVTQNELLIISKYFNNMNNYFNVIKTCKEYNEILNLLNFNPIPLTNKNYKYFNNIQTLHLYNKNDFEILNVPKIIWYKNDYNTYKNDYNTYKNIKIIQKDINKYGIDILNSNSNENLIHDIVYLQLKLYIIILTKYNIVKCD